MHALKEACSSAIFLLQVLGIALVGAIGYRNVSRDDWEDYMNLAPLPPGAWRVSHSRDSPMQEARWRSSRSVHLPQ
jgi:hypothetical protein